MPRTRSLAWSELKVGIVSVFALVMALLLLFMLTGEGGFFWQKYALRAVFDDVAGLKPGAPVRLAGVEIGSVTAVEFSGSQVEVSMEVADSVQDRITSESVASLGSVSLLGESAVDITASIEGSPVEPFGYVSTGRGSGSLTEMAGEAALGIEEATKLIQDLRAGRGTLGKLFSDDSLYLELNRFVDAAEDVIRSVSEGEGTLGHLTRDPAAGKALEAALQNLETITTRLKDGEGSFGKLMQDDAFAESLTSTTANLENLIAGMNRGEGTIGKLVTDKELYNRLNSLSGRLDEMLEKLEDGEGTVGQLLHDQQLYENMNVALTELRSLIEDIRKDPKRFLNIRVSLF